jgi:hypothetical protein
LRPSHTTDVVVPAGEHVTVRGRLFTRPPAASRILIWSGHEPERLSDTGMRIVVWRLGAAKGFGVAVIAPTTGPALSRVIVSRTLCETLPARSR